MGRKLIVTSKKEQKETSVGHSSIFFGKMSIQTSVPPTQLVHARCLPGRPSHPLLPLRAPLARTAVQGLVLCRDVALAGALTISVPRTTNRIM